MSSPRPAPETASAPAAHTVLVRHADDGRGLLVSHTLCSAPAAYVAPRPVDGGVLMTDLIQSVVGHTCLDGVVGQTVGSLL